MRCRHSALSRLCAWFWRSPTRLDLGDHPTQDRARFEPVQHVRDLIHRTGGGWNVFEFACLRQHHHFTQLLQRAHIRALDRDGSLRHGDQGHGNFAAEQTHHHITPAFAQGCNAQVRCALRAHQIDHAPNTARQRLQLALGIFMQGIDLFKRLTAHARMRPCIPPSPPKPLVLAGWAYSNDVEKMRCWEETVAWARVNGCADVIEISEQDFYYVEEPTSYAVGPMGDRCTCPGT